MDDENCRGRMSGRLLVRDAISLSFYTSAYLWQKTRKAALGASLSPEKLFVGIPRGRSTTTTDLDVHIQERDSPGPFLHTLIRSTYSTSCNALDWHKNRLYHRPIRLCQLRIKLDAHYMWSAIVQMATSLCTATRISFDVTWLVFFISISPRLLFFFKYFVSLSPALCICCSRT